METIRIASNIHGIASLLALLWLVVTAVLFWSAWGLPWLREWLGRRGATERSSQVAAALLEHPEVCDRCAYPRASGDECPECGQPYATGLARRGDEADRKHRGRRMALRRMGAAAVVLGALTASGMLADAAYARANVARWGAPYPKVRAYMLNLVESVLVEPNREATTYRLHIRARGMADTWAPFNSSHPYPPLARPEYQLWIETGPNAGSGPGPHELPTPWRVADGRASIEAAIAEVYAAAGLDDGSPQRDAQMALAADGVEALIRGQRKPAMAAHTNPPYPRFSVQATGSVMPPPTPFEPLRPAAMAGVAAGSVPLVLGVLLVVWQLRRRAASATLAR